MSRELVIRAALMPVAFLAFGCGPVGPEVKVSGVPGGWAPARVAVLPPAVAGNAIPAARALPGSLTIPSVEEAATRTVEELSEALRETAGLAVVSGTESFSRTLTAGLAEKLGRQYLDGRVVDKELARSLGEGLEADAVLVTALLRYGPEVEGDLQRMQQSAQTKVGSSDLAISSAATSAVIYFNAHLRCALVRLSDGAVVWDAAIRGRGKNSLLSEATQETVLHDAVAGLFKAFPWRRDRPSSVP